MALKLEKPKVDEARHALDQMKKLEPNDPDKVLFDTIYREITDNLLHSAHKAEFSWKRHIPLSVLFRLWLTFRVQEYEVDISFDPQKLTFSSYC